MDRFHGMRRVRLALVTGLVALCAAAAFGQSTLSGDEVMDKVYNAPRPGGTMETLTMVITKGSQSLTRSLTIRSAGDHTKGQTEKTLIKFTAPADVKGSGFLTLKKVDGSTESLLWLPALGRVRRLGGGNSDQDQAFFGSDFTNRDINGFDQADFTYRVTGVTDGIYTVEATPKKAVGFEKLVYQIDSSIWKYVKIEYWRSGKLVKTQIDEYQKVGDYYVPTRIVMTSVSKSATELKFSDYKVDLKLGDEIFTERFLKQ